jgi:hypothetical protein
MTLRRHPLFLAALTAALLLALPGMGQAASYTAINVPGATSTHAQGINNLGQIVGGYRNGTGAHGFLLSRGVYISTFPEERTRPPSGSMTGGRWSASTPQAATSTASCGPAAFTPL